MGTMALAGCLDSIGRIGDGTNPDGNDIESHQDSVEPVGPPTSETTLVLPDSTDALANSRISGGVRKDGIPSIDEPSFMEAARADEWLEGSEPVFGVAMNDAVKAYPQRVVVWHEIVNDRIGGENIAVTYCPLTGTAQGFKRGDTEFGVSGQLINSNLVMYDRGTDSLWPQMLATAIEGEFEGSVLQEFPVTWTTWDQWHDVYPDTLVLSDDTGYARNYDDDPYGSYAPRGGFYADDSLLFEPYSSVDTSEIDHKDIVLGARWHDGGLAVKKDRLAAEGLLNIHSNAGQFVAVYDTTLDTGYIYSNPDDQEVSLEAGVASVNGDEYSPSNLPLNRVIRFDAFWFAWAGYYPDATVVN